MALGFSPARISFCALPKRRILMYFLGVICRKMVQVAFVYTQLAAHIIHGDLLAVVPVDVLKGLFQCGMDGQQFYVCYKKTRPIANRLWDVFL